MAVPIAEDTVDNRTQVELDAKSVKLQSTIDARGGKGSLVNLESIGALRQLHCGVDDGVQLDCYLVGLNGL